jgi:hypothetical protein
MQLEHDGWFLFFTKHQIPYMCRKIIFTFNYDQNLNDKKETNDLIIGLILLLLKSEKNT